MASIRAKDGKLFFDFRHLGQRCREYSVLDDTPENRRKMAKILKRIEVDIAAGSFSYRRYFPNSRMAPRFEDLTEQLQASVPVGPTASSHAVPSPTTPTLCDFAKTWFAQMSVEWRISYAETVQQIIDQHLSPAFGDRAVGSIRRDEILTFRSELAKVPGRKGKPLSPRRINAIILVLRQILNEAADRFEFITPTGRIKRLKQPRSDVQPFSLDEVRIILERVRPDFHHYLKVRFLTGMRSGEIDGLKWKYVDFERRLILVRETRVHGRVEYTKTDSSQREIRMSEPVYQSLKAQAAVSRQCSEYVFCTNSGQPVDANNFTKRVWYPLLRFLGIEARRPYQTRHTAATLWLAAGENPEWVARQMGHANTQMLFKVYSRYIPNLTRQDGSAFERLLAGSLDKPPLALLPPPSADALPASPSSHPLPKEFAHA